jgi:uncharacterized protein
MSNPSRPDAIDAPLGNDDVESLQSMLDSVPAPLEPLDVSSLDGFLCGVLLQPHDVPPQQWLRYVLDIEGRAVPGSFAGQPLQAMVLRRLAELKRAIDARDWFDPWVFELDDAATPGQALLPWVAGFAAAMELFPELMRTEDSALLEPLSLLYMHFDAADLEDADALRAMIDTLEPPTDLADAVQDLVRSLMLIADVTRPRSIAKSVHGQRRAPTRRRR